jgi:hypothetical protein
MYVNDPNLSYYDVARDIDARLEKGESPPDIIFVDTIRTGFSTGDENDNSEATEQMKRVRQDVDRWHSCVVLVHHSSKANAPGTRKGSGAHARAAMADVCWNFECPDEESHPDIVKVEIPKNRMIDDRFRVFLRKELYKFVPCDPPPGLGVKGYMATTIRYQTQRILQDLLPVDIPKNAWTLQQELEQRVGHKVAKQTVHLYLSRLIGLGVAQKTCKGRYALRNGGRPIVDEGEPEPEEA